MYYATDNFIMLAFIEVILERLKDIKNKYLDLDMMRTGMNALIRELHKEAADMPLYTAYYCYLSKTSDLSWYEAPFEKDKNAFKESLDSLKPLIEAGDFLFLKAFISDDEEELKFMFRLAQVMNPEDTLLYLLVNTVYSMSEFNEQEMYQLIQGCPIKPGKGKARDLFDIVTLIVDFKNTPEKLRPDHLQNLVDRGPLFTPLLYSLAYEKKDAMEPSTLLEILMGLNFRNQEMRLRFELIKCRLWHKTGAFSRALLFLETTDFDLYGLDEGEQLDIQVLLAKLYEQDGQHGKALLIWQSVIDNESYRTSIYDSYFEAMARLALVYAKSSRVAEALEILFINGRTGVTVVIDFFKTDYYVLRGEICLAEKRRDKAVKMYRKALALSEDKMLRERVKLVEMDLL